MEFTAFIIEMAALSCLMAGLHRLRDRYGLAPLYTAVGLLIGTIMIGGRIKLSVPLPGGGQGSYTALLGLGTLLAVMAIVYTLEGTSAARRLLAAAALTSLFLLAVRIILSWQLELSGVDLSLFGRERWLITYIWPHLVSAAAFVLDGLTIIVIYQALLNLRRVPRVVALTLALVGAMVADGLFYGGLSGQFDLGQFTVLLGGKALTGVAAAVPASLYISTRMKRFSRDIQNGVLERGAFEIVDLRRQVQDVRSALQRSRAEYEEVRNLFSRYVVPDVVDEILKDTSRIKLGGETRDVTILFSDIRGYSTLSEQMSPEATIDLLNEYFGAMSDVIEARKGTIIEFEGDAILTVFGAPLHQDDHATRAVQTALAMLESVMELNARWEEDGTADNWKHLGLGTFKIRIGIHSGTVVVGNVGSQARTKYAVIGDTVNTAARVESMNKTLRTTLLLSDATRARLDPDFDVDLRDMGVHRVKGRVEAVHVYTVPNLPAAEGEAYRELAVELRDDIALDGIDGL